MSYGNWSGDLAEPEGPQRNPVTETWARVRVAAVRAVHAFAGTPRILVESRAWEVCERVSDGAHFRRVAGGECSVCGIRGWEA